MEAVRTFITIPGHSGTRVCEVGGPHDMRSRMTPPAPRVLFQMGLSGLAGAVMAAELCAPLLLLCGLCCWPAPGASTDCSETSSTGKHPKKPTVVQGAGRRRRSSEAMSRRGASSAISLHLPSTSGHSKELLSAHRSHEEIRSRHRSHLEAAAAEEDGRYHSAPSVIDEVLHRRDWERSSKELYIPLNPDRVLSDADSDLSADTPAPRAEAESSSVECLKSTDRLSVSCKKHYTNIKSSRNRTTKESNQDDVKDTDATEDESETNVSNFYIGESRTEASTLSREEPATIETGLEEKIKSVYKAKDAKQTMNESIKCMKPHVASVDDHDGGSPLPCQVQTVDYDLDLCAGDVDRSGAMHHDAQSRASLVSCVSSDGALPPSSVEAVGWEGGACYLAEGGKLRGRLLAGRWPGGRARHASDGDILAPAGRPESGAFSESDLELELEGGEERPPEYGELRPPAPARETAI